MKHERDTSVSTADSLSKERKVYIRNNKKGKT